MEKILIGKIVNAVGLKGEVKVYCYTDRKERFQELGQIWVEKTLCQIQRARYQGNVAILKLEGIEDRNQAEAQKNKGVFIEESQLDQLPEDTYYVRDLIGIQVLQEDGSLLGTLTDVIQNSSQDLYQVELENGKRVLVPAVREFVLDICMEERQMTVSPPDGLLEL
ncbi:MAG: 16S rRNA processing protein RimM [Firmicutes bacterium]|jgi:16S rRNA processing protein RimM|nr:16S rRNA processing protein RimM [Bacillota bacterium]NBI62813.1 16S rRNA processing protein RimM [Clostridiales bacterium]